MYGNYADRNIVIEAKRMIESGRFSAAYDLLKTVMPGDRSAEWFYLAGKAASKLGMYEESEDYMKKARFMDPDNREYDEEYSRFNEYRNGYDNRARYYNERRRYDSSGCLPCCCCCGDDCCTTCCQLWCCDSCCECMGGDFITCC